MEPFACAGNMSQEGGGGAEEGAGGRTQSRLRMVEHDVGQLAAVDRIPAPSVAGVVRTVSVALVDCRLIL